MNTALYIIAFLIASSVCCTASLLRICTSFIYFFVGINFMILDDYYHTVICLSVGFILFTYSLLTELEVGFGFNIDFWADKLCYYAYIFNAFAISFYLFQYVIGYDLNYAFLFNIFVCNVLYAGLVISDQVKVLPYSDLPVFSHR